MEVLYQDAPVYSVWLTTFTGDYKRYDYSDLESALKFIETNKDEFVTFEKRTKLHIR